MADGEADETPAQRCSFCDKGVAEVDRLIAGHSAYICDDCVRLSAAVVGPRESAEVIRCSFCWKTPAETSFFGAGHGGYICGDCVDSMMEAHAMSDPAYREQAIERLKALTDGPWLPNWPTPGKREPD